MSKYILVTSGVISLIGSGLGILASQLLIARMEKKGTVSRTGTYHAFFPFVCKGIL